MALLLLVRHGRSSANAQGILAGRAGGVRLDELGTTQARQAGTRLLGVSVAAAVSSPLLRCRETTRLMLETVPAAPAVQIEPGLTECDYGDWSGRPLGTLSREGLWKTVQHQPSAVSFPGGESLAAMQARAVEAVRRHDAAVERDHGAHAIWVAVSHGDIIKSVLADALGLHLDLFQRIVVDPASISIVQYAESRPLVLGMNTREGALSWLRPAKGRSRPRAATVGGGAGPEELPGAPH